MKEHILTYSEKSLDRARRLRRESTNSEKKLWMCLRNNQLGAHFRRQAPCGSYVVDFLALKPRLVIELDGSQHYTERGLGFDRRRDAYLRRRGLTVLRFSNVEKIKNIDGVIATIEGHLRKNLSP